MLDEKFLVHFYDKKRKAFMYDELDDMSFFSEICFNNQFPKDSTRLIDLSSAKTFFKLVV